MKAKKILKVLGITLLILLILILILLIIIHINANKNRPVMNDTVKKGMELVQKNFTVTKPDEAFVPERALSGLQGWVDCFERAELTDSLFCGGLTDAGEAAAAEQKLKAAYAFGKALA